MDLSFKNIPIELHPLAIAKYADYNAIAAMHAVSRDSLIGTIGKEAMLLQQAPTSGSTSHEVVSWRIDGIITPQGDKGYDYAIRSQMAVRPVGAPTRCESLTAEPLMLHELAPKDLARTARSISKAGFLVHDIELRQVPVQEVQIGKMSMAQFSRAGKKYTASPYEGEPVTFPRTIPYETVLYGAYDLYCGEILGGLSTTQEMASRLAYAQAADSRGSRNAHDNMQAYEEATRAYPEMPGVIRSLADALYDYDPAAQRGLSPALAAALSNPLAARAAGAALHNQWSYRRHLGGRNYTELLQAQLQTIIEHGPLFALEAQVTLSSQYDALTEHIDDQLTKVGRIARLAQSMAQTYSAPNTLSLTDSSWLVRAR